MPKQKEAQYIWVEPVSDPVPYPSPSALGPLKFISEPTRLPDTILSQLYWQERFRTELRIVEDKEAKKLEAEFLKKLKEASMAKVVEEKKPKSTKKENDK